MKKIAIITDFGNSHYAGIIKGVILSINQSIPIIDITHNISPQNIIEGAFILKESMPYFDQNTVFLVIVDPTVGSSRRGIVVKSEGRVFVGPDNGIFEFIFQNGSYELLNIVKSDFYTKNISSTFHGRDIFAPLSAIIASDRNYSDIVKKTENPIRLNIPQPALSEKTISGEILYIDSFGNIITNIPYELIKNYHCSVKIKNRRLGRIRKSYSEVPIGYPVAIIGSSNMIEIAVNSGSAARWFNIKDNSIKKTSITISIRPIKARSQ